jgi:uroporphyrin-III C-methyltransferase / precorrin-2 dehydrogenase / sirohydrochlorin ferrochelatase
MIGLVSLVGAGPGDPELLTVKASRRLAEADLVLYDGLVSSEALKLASKAHCFFVGKRAGRPGIRQADIHTLMIKEARRGRRVVRLKCGDPFVLGRGGEEGLALAEAGIPFEVVPGVSAALAAPGLAGIPLTHRGLSSGFLVISGHAEAAYRPALESLAPNAATLMVLMGLSTRPSISSLLLKRGWAPTTPAAILLGASLQQSWSWRGCLADLGEAKIPDASADLPGCLCVGEVVSLASQLAQSFSDEADVRRSGTRR